MGISSAYPCFFILKMKVVAIVLITEYNEGNIGKSNPKRNAGGADSMITSTSNARIKRLVTLKKKRKARDEEGVFLTEGIRMFREVPKGWLKELYVSESFWEKDGELVKEQVKRHGISFEVLSDRVYEYVSDTKTPQGVLCVIGQQREMCPEDLLKPGQDGKQPFLMVLDNLQDPGNMGTIIRTAEGAGVTGVLMSRDCVDIYNPKTIRSTMGSIYRMPCCYTDDLQGMLGQMKETGIRTYAAHLAGNTYYDEEDYTTGCAFLIGNEGNGLREEIAKLADTYIKIPMEGEVESLNAAIAATVLMFEAGRQRRQK